MLTGDGGGIVVLRCGGCVGDVTGGSRGGGNTVLINGGGGVVEGSSATLLPVMAWFIIGDVAEKEVWCGSDAVVVILLLLPCE